ncbi:MAG: hypothetical protein ACJ79R_12250 [Anaeromyxobacteraceae bacterium]
MADRIAKAILTVWLGGAALVPAAAMAGPGLGYGHDDSGYADDVFLAAPPAPPLAAQRAPVAIAAAPATMAAASPADGGTGSAGAPAGASATRVVCHEVSADATEEQP